MSSFLAFMRYFASALVLLAVFVVAYVHLTPYKEFELIRRNNQAAAISLSGAILGFTFPLLSSIYYTQSLPEMALWAAITGLVQFAVFLLMRSQAAQIEAGDTAPATLLATLSVAVGLINALCISH